MLVVIVDHNLEVGRPDPRLLKVLLVHSLLLRRSGVKGVIAPVFGLLQAQRIIFYDVVLCDDGVLGQFIIRPSQLFLPMGI